MSYQQVQSSTHVVRTSLACFPRTSFLVNFQLEKCMIYADCLKWSRQFFIEILRCRNRQPEYLIHWISSIVSGWSHGEATAALYEFNFWRLKKVPCGSKCSYLFVSKSGTLAKSMSTKSCVHLSWSTYQKCVVNEVLFPHLHNVWAVSMNVSSMWTT